MAIRIYIIPIVGTGVQGDPYRPKYISDYAIAWGAMDYENHGYMLVGADVDDATHASIAGNADAYAIPANLDATLTMGQVTAVHDKLEAINLPADWITTAFTWRQILRLVSAILCLARRFNALDSALADNLREKIFSSGITLDTRFNALPTAKRNKLITMGQSFGFDTTGLSGTNTLRVILRNLAQQFSEPIQLGVVTI